MTLISRKPAPVRDLPEIIIEGATGVSGGPTGPAGPMGAVAPIGPTGFAGPVGSTETGPTGPGAFFGPTGARGATGPADFASATGPTGDYGDYGIDGPTGDDGPVGKTGSIGPAASPTGIQGTTGPIGRGSVGGLSAPFFGDSEVYLTQPIPQLGVGPITLGYASLSSSSTYLLPVFVPFARTYTEMIIDSEAAWNPTIMIKLGIYDCTETMHPTTVKFDSGSITPIGKGRVAVPMSVALDPKPYLLAFVTNGAARFKVLSVTAVIAPLGLRKLAANTGWSTEAQHLRAATGFVPFPNLTATTVTIGSGFVPLLGIR